MRKCNKQSMNDAFRGENTTSKKRLTYLQFKKQQKGTADVCRGENTTSKIRLMYLEVKIQQLRYE